MLKAEGGTGPFCSFFYILLSSLGNRNGEVQDTRAKAIRSTLL